MPDRAGRRRAERAGRSAEAATALLLMLKGYSILARRLRTPAGELDLVVRRGRAVAFVEVKLRRRAVEGLEAITPRGRRRIAAAAHWWLAANPGYDGYILRFDVVMWVPWAWPRHIRHAFDAM